MGSIPGPLKIPHAAKQLNPCATTPSLRSATRGAPATRESQCTATKTQHRQKGNQTTQIKWTTDGIGHSTTKLENFDYT